MWFRDVNAVLDLSSLRHRVGMALCLPFVHGLTFCSCAFIMVLPSKILGQISNVFIWLSTIIFFIILVALPIYGKKSGNYNSAKDMFTSSYNQTAWSNSGWVFLMTFLTPCWCISGYDSTGAFIGKSCQKNLSLTAAQHTLPRRRKTPLEWFPGLCGYRAYSWRFSAGYSMSCSPMWLRTLTRSSNPLSASPWEQ